MDVVWSRHLSWFSVSDVLGVLAKRREIAYTTVMTTVARLYDKGLLARRKDGKRYLYQPALSREEFLQRTAREVFQEIGKPAAAESLALLVEMVSAADERSLDELERLIALRRKEIDA
jgi:predicted transcriptional regulator